MHAPSVITYQSCELDKKRQVSNETCLFLVYSLGFCRFRFAEPRQSVVASLLARTVASHLYSRIQKTPHMGVFWCTRWGFAVSASQNLGKASALRFSREPWLLTFTAGYKKHPIWGCFGVPAGVRTQTRRRRRP